MISSRLSALARFCVDLRYDQTRNRLRLFAQALVLARERPATNSGVSAENVVATMDVPATNQGSERPSATYVPTS